MLAQLPQNEWTRESAAHLLSRAAFGGTPEEIDTLYALGRDQGLAAAVDSLVATTETWESIPWPNWALDENDLNGDLWGGQAQRRYSFTSWYFNCLQNGQPLAGKVLKFLVDHFAVDSATSNQYTRFMYFFRFFEMLRRHAAGDVDGDGRYGNLKTLITDMSWSEAMIRTLDLYQSRRGSINENFGRELLELFTLGVDGGYTEDDVGAAAEAFTGRKVWGYQSPHPNAPTVRPTNLAPEGQLPGGSYQVENQQDNSAKSFMGFDKMPNGSDIVDGDDIIELLFTGIVTSKHICWKLWRYFVAPNPAEETLQTLALSFRDTHAFEIRPLLREIFLSAEFYDSANQAVQVKDGGDLIVTLSKQLDAAAVPGRALYSINNSIGYDILLPPNIAGWPEPEGEGNGWLSAGAMIFRMNLPSIWTHKNYSVIADGRARNNFNNYPEIDWDAIAPPELREPNQFPLLLDHLNKRFLPLVEIRPSQARALRERYEMIAAKIDTLEAVKELLRLILALPEYQVQ